jgi:hypothetical protein
MGHPLIVIDVTVLREDSLQLHQAEPRACLPADRLVEGRRRPRFNRG